ncbi:MAG: 4,5-DOPA dioxygenase extradiol [Bdellovibrionales bacterium]
MQPLSSKTLPSLFICHGSPMNAIEDNKYTQTLKRLGDSIERPKAILVISAHWETNGLFITGMDKPRTIHDFFGFPEELFKIQYPAPGNPNLAGTIADAIGAEIDDSRWGLDHGTWAILRHMYPEADIPVLQLSLDKPRTLKEHFELGSRLAYLRAQDVLIIGSGNIVHNLMEIKWAPGSTPHSWAVEYDQIVKDSLKKRDFDSLIQSPRSNKLGRNAHPTIEHYLPLIYILGTSNGTDQLTFEYEEIQNGSISMTSFRFQNRE